MAVNDIFLVNLFTTLEGQQIVNTFTYKALENGCNSQDFANSAKTIIHYAMSFITVRALGYDAFSVTNLNNDLDFYNGVYVPDTHGEIDNPYIPAWNAIAFGCPTKNKAIKAGAKRIAGVAESWTNGNLLHNYVENTTRLAQFCTVLGQTIDDASGNSYAPIIVKRTKQIVEGKPRYTLPKVATTLNHYTATGWFFKFKLTSQNSRKV